MKAASLVLAATLLSSGPALAQDPALFELPAGWIVAPPRGFLPEPALLNRVAIASESSSANERRDGFYVSTGDLITGAGWISARPGYQKHLFDRRAILDGSAAVSSRLYSAAQLSLEVPHVGSDRIRAGVQGSFQDARQVKYFGSGAGASEDAQTAYRLRSGSVLAFSTLRLTRVLAVDGRFGWLPDLDVSAAKGPRVRVPSTIYRFTEDTAPGITAQPAFLHGDVSIAADFRDHPGHPTAGGMYRATAAAFSDRDNGRYSFRRYEVEASQFIPLFSRRWVFGVNAWWVLSDTSSDSVVPFYLQPSLGGQNTLRGFHDYRFHDRHMESFTAESRWALLTHVDVAAFADAGKVAAERRDLDLRGLERSFGGGLRMHNATSTLVRLDAAHSTEGWRIYLSFKDPFMRSVTTVGRRVIPFVP